MSSLGYGSPSRNSSSKPGSSSNPWPLLATSSSNSGIKYSDAQMASSPVTGPAEEGSAAESFLQKSGERVYGDVPIDLVRGLYLGNAATGANTYPRHPLQRRNSSVIYPGVPPDYPPVKKLNPLNKKRILVTGVSKTILFMEQTSFLPMLPTAI